jgi:integrase/recombinase XerD
MREGKAKVLSGEEWSRLLRVVAVEMYSERNTAILYCSHGLGLRVGEISSLVIGDVVHEDGTLKDHFQIKRANSKTNQNREVFLTNNKVRRALQTYLDVRHNQDGQFHLEAPLFKTQKGLAFTGNSMQQMMKRLFRKAALPETVSSHSGRRGFATRLLGSGIGIRNVATLMGHGNNINQTAAYADSNPDTLSNVAAKAI